MSLDGFSMHALVRELNNKLAGGRIDRISQPSKQNLLLSVRQPGQNYLLNISISSQNPAAYLIENPLENPAEPPVFCMVLRKQIEGGRIAELHQHGLDRLLILEIDHLGAGGEIVTKNLIIELMGKYSNIILTQDDKIIDALRKIGQNSSRVRTVLPGDSYALPPSQDKLDLITQPIEDIMMRIKKQDDMKLSKAILNSCMGFGPVSAREACYLAGLPEKFPIAELSPSDLESLKNALIELREAIASPSEPMLLRDENKKILAVSAFPLHSIQAAEKCSFPSVSALLEAADRWTGSYVLPDRDRFRRLVRNETSRAAGKLEKLRIELETAENASLYKIYGDNLMTYQYELKDHAENEASLVDIYSETGDLICIPLDPRLTILQNMQTCYKKYDKLKRAQAMLLDQIEKCEQELHYLATIDASLDSSTTMAEIAEIQNELIDAGYLHEKRKKKNNDKPAHPFHFYASDGKSILVGKNNFQNDRLTFKIADQKDLWLHTKDIPGSHVIFRTGGEEPSDELLLEAAYLAAHFSQAQGSSKIPVDCTEVRYVKKPAGSKPGFVIFTHQKTLYVTPEEDILQKLLASEKTKKI